MKPDPFTTLDRRWRILLARTVRELHLTELVDWLNRKIERGTDA